jgi:hypothetical protein
LNENDKQDAVLKIAKAEQALPNSIFWEAALPSGVV